MPCTCGGCNSCLKDQGVMTDAEIAIREQAIFSLTEKIKSMQFQEFIKATQDYMADDAFFDIWNLETYYQHKRDHENAAKCAIKKLNYLRDAYIADNLQAEIDRIIKDANEP